MKVQFSFTLLFLIVLNTFAQNDTLIEVYGKIINGETLKPVPYAFVINMNKHFGTKTDTSGKFRILISPGDNLKVSSLGFESYIWKPNPKNAKLGKINKIIYLKPINYHLGNVDIYAVRWKAFVNDIANTEVKEDKTQKRIEIWIRNVLKNENLKTIADLARGTGVIIPLPLKSKKERELRKLAKIKQKEQLQKQLDKKFNRNLVAKITGLKGKELDDFMQYCDFDRDFILKTSEYDLIVIIKDMYKEYENNKHKR